MSLQFIQDNNGNTTGVYIPIEDWQNLKQQYVELNGIEAAQKNDLADWQKEIIDNRLADYYKNPSSNIDINDVLNELKKSI
jgi:lipase chaperone LimK